MLISGLEIDDSYLPASQLKLPFRSGTDVEITEGYFYSSEEAAIHGLQKHFGIDFAAPFGTSVYAVRDGFVLQSKHIAYLKCPDGQERGYGLGNFVAQLCFADNGNPFYVIYGHLNTVDDAVPYFEPKWENDECDPTVLYQAHDQFQVLSTRVKVGDIIGTVGQSGLAASRGSQESWDEPHLHFEVFFRSLPSFFKDPKRRFDPFGLYSTQSAYRKSLKEKLSHSDLWQRDRLGSVLYAY